MPIYEYQCSDCGHRMDALQKISEPALVQCPACARDGLKKLVSAPQFRLKGSGWYETDFKKDKRRNLAGEDKKPAVADKAEGGAAGKDGGSSKAGGESSKTSGATEVAAAKKTNSGKGAQSGE